VNENCQAPQLADLIITTYLPEQQKDIHALKSLKAVLDQMVNGATTAERIHHELMFDKDILQSATTTN